MKSFIILLILITLNSWVLKAQTTPRADVCTACVQDTTGGYISIEDTLKWNPVCNYELLTRDHLAGKLESRDTISFWPGNMHSLYKKSGYSMGHCIPYEDLAYSPITAKASMHLKRNLAPQPQGQNIGTKLACENLTRQLALKYGAVKVWGGTAGSLGKVKGINIPEVYWTIIQTPDGEVCYLMPTTGDFTAYADIDHCLFTYQDLVAKIGLDPEKIINK